MIISVTRQQDSVPVSRMWPIVLVTSAVLGSGDFLSAVSASAMDLLTPVTPLQVYVSDVETLLLAISVRGKFLLKNSVLNKFALLLL